MTPLRDKLSSLPLKPGVYLFKDRRGEILYIGKAKSLRKRVAAYFSKSPDLKTAILLERLNKIDYIITSSEMKALILENELIKKYKPRYNISLKDDKAYPYLKLTIKEQWPRLFLVRQKKKDGALYFGPFQGKMVRAAVRLVKKLFPIRWCKETPMRMRKQSCLYYRMGSCSGPCIQKISLRDYGALIKGIVLLLEGNMEGALFKLSQEMEKASQKQEFERAGYLRDRIKILQKMLEGKELPTTPSPRLLSNLKELKSALKLEKLPMRIEAFDVSNLSGTNLVGSMVAFYGGAPLKRDYRRFKIKNLEGKPNDAASIYEIVKRRYAGALSKNLECPDLVLVDGGRPQVNAAHRAIKSANLEKIPTIGLAKRQEEVFVYGKGRPLKLSKHSPALQLLQHLRDEAHRFALAYHRVKREKFS